MCFFNALSHERKTNPIGEIESRRGGKGQGSISDLDPTGDLKFRIPSELEGSFRSVASSESFRAGQNREEKMVEGDGGAC